MTTAYQLNSHLMQTMLENFIATTVSFFLAKTVIGYLFSLVSLRYFNVCNECITPDTGWSLFTFKWIFHFS